MYASSNDVIGNQRNNGLDNTKTCENQEKEFFSLFDFATTEHTSSATADSPSSPLKSFQGAASAVFGGIWSALDTAIALLNEDMENSTEEICSASEDNDQNIAESDLFSESIEKVTEEATNELNVTPTIVFNSSKEEKFTAGML